MSNIVAENVLLICSDDEYSRAAQITREVLHSSNVAVVKVAGTATQRLLVTRILLSLPESDYGLAQQVADCAAQECRTRLALTSVAGLAVPVPTLPQHLRSFFPNASFVVDFPNNTVASEKEIVWSLNPNADSAIAQSERSGHLDVSVSGAEPVEVTETRGSSWRAREWVELSELEPAYTILPRITSLLEKMHCRLCGRTLAGPECPFCGVTVMPSASSSRIETSHEKVAL